MFKAEDFHLPLEKELRLCTINTEIDECTDIVVLKSSLKEVTKQLMQYQNLLTVVLQKQLEREIKNLLPDIK